MHRWDVPQLLQCQAVCQPSTAPFIPLHSSHMLRPCLQCLVCHPTSNRPAQAGRCLHRCKHTHNTSLHPLHAHMLQHAAHHQHSGACHHVSMQALAVQHLVASCTQHNRMCAALPQQQAGPHQQAPATAAHVTTQATSAAAHPTAASHSHPPPP